MRSNAMVFAGFAYIRRTGQIQLQENEILIAGPAPLNVPRIRTTTVPVSVIPKPNKALTRESLSSSLTAGPDCKKRQRNDEVRNYGWSAESGGSAVDRSGSSALCHGDMDPGRFGCWPALLRAASHEMQHEQYHRDNEYSVSQSAGSVKCEKSNRAPRISLFTAIWQLFRSSQEYSISAPYCTALEMRMCDFSPSRRL